jgi:hypothetical protein
MMRFLIFIPLVFLLFACSESDKDVTSKSTSSKNKINTSAENQPEEPKSAIQTTEVAPTKPAKKNVEPLATSRTDIQKTQSNQVKSALTENIKAAIPSEWKISYSQDKKWMELYTSSCNFFLNGWINEFEKHPEARISKDELLLAYRKRMENIFYETPSFIEFCVQEMKVSAEFEQFCKMWSENID